jgi:hypothetical protein
MGSNEAIRFGSCEIENKGSGPLPTLWIIPQEASVDRRNEETESAFNRNLSPEYVKSPQSVFKRAERHVPGHAREPQ